MTWGVGWRELAPLSRMSKGVRLVGHPDTESCRRSATPTPSTPESRDLEQVLRPSLPSLYQERTSAAPL